ncbi:YciI family protein [Streptomyces sp. NBC_00457]|uniref:YciI family protein n=1 Tax=Streptomyces sp. NBC_00457 TaxID=2975748 RepID=UPI002E2176CA
MALYLLSVGYIQPMEEVSKHFEGHVSWLQAKYASGVLLGYAKKVPLTGGIIFATASSREELDAVIAGDPFVKAEVAAYDVTELDPTRLSPALLEFAEEKS